MDDPLMAKVTIAIPTLNHSMLRECISSIINNTVPGFRMVVVTDAPDKDMVQYLGFLMEHNARAIINPQKVGVPKAMNQLLRVSQTEYTMLMNDDCFVQKHDWLTPLVKALDEHPEYGVVTPSLMLMGVDNGPDFFAALGEASLISRKVVEKVGFFDEDERWRYICVDADYYIRLQRAGFKIHGVRDSLVFHICAGTTIQYHNKEMYAAAEALLTEKYGDEWKVDQHRFEAV
jgi:GT2 family glycosyltransferase